MKLLNRIILDCIKEHEGGEKFFDRLDEIIRNEKLIVSRLMSLVNDDLLYNDGIVVSGKFGVAFSNYYNNCFCVTKELIIVEGGLRKGNKINDLSYLDMVCKNYIFIDDSFYSGRTRNVIKDEIERNGGSLIKTYVVYDGSKTKDSDVKSLYRYYDNYNRGGTLC